jgi:dUTP pyrophosphatase
MDKDFVPDTVITVKFERLHEKAILPKRMSEKASGLDLFVHFLYEESEGMILPHSREVFGTGVAVQLPEGYEGQIRSRSGMAAKQGVFVLNSPGTIDEDYRGELLVILHNTTDKIVKLKYGDRIAQLVISKVARLPYIEVAELSDTKRSDGGLGSTGTGR